MLIYLIKLVWCGFGLDPKPQARTYQKPYPDYYEHVPYPPGYRISDFAKFTGANNRTMFEKYRPIYYIVWRS